MKKPNYSLKWEDKTVYPIANPPGKRDGLSQILIRVHSPKRSITVPVYNGGIRTVKINKHFFIDGKITGGVPKDTLDHYNAIITSIQVKVWDAIKVYGLNSDAIKRAVYDREDPLTLTYRSSEQEYTPDVQALLKKNGYDRMPDDLLEEIINLKLFQQGIKKDHPLFSEYRKEVLRTQIYRNPVVEEKISEQELKSFNIKLNAAKNIPTNVDADDLEDLKKQSVQADRIDTERKRIEGLPAIERYKHAYYDKTNIFHLFSWCRYGRIYNKAKDEYKKITPKSYDPILINLIDYQINAKPKEHVKDLNLDWVQNFLIYLSKKGYIKDIGQKTQKFNPFHPDLDLFKKSERENYETANSFFSKVKELKRYLYELKNAGYIKDDFADKFEAKDFHNFQENQDYEAKYFITPAIFYKICTVKLLDKQLEHTRDLFVCQVLLGGIPPIDFYDQSKMKLKHSGGDELVLKFFRRKTGGKIVNPILKPVLSITKKYGGQLPPPVVAATKTGKKPKNGKEFSEVIYTARLRRLFEIVVPDELFIEEVADLVNGGYRELEPSPLYEKISPKFARSTCVVLFYSLGIKPEMIMSFTGHKKSDVFYKHYFSILQRDKRDFANDALSKMFGKVDIRDLVA